MELYTKLYEFMQFQANFIEFFLTTISFQQNCCLNTLIWGKGKVKKYGLYI